MMKISINIKNKSKKNQYNFTTKVSTNYNYFQLKTIPIQYNFNSVKIEKFGLLQFPSEQTDTSP